MSGANIPSSLLATMLRGVTGINSLPAELKPEALLQLSESKGYDLSQILYVGNDLNDFHVMKICGYSACPADSHKKIKELSNVVLNTRGGEGVVRELLEEVLNLDFIKILY